MENKVQFLPLGSVVLLKGGKKRVMITGFCLMSEEQDKKIYDYCGCIYPEGTVSTKHALLFNNSQIQKVFALGYSDNEEKAFRQKLVQKVTEMVNKQKQNNTQNNNQG